MFLVVTRNFPPDVGGMQILMDGLTKSLIEHGPVKVFANEFQNSDLYDKKISAEIHRVSGLKLFQKYRKANLVNEFIEKNSNIRAIFFDHWKSLELINENLLKKTKTFCLIHSKEINHIPGSRLNKRFLKSFKKADHIISNSNFTKKLAIKMNIEEKKINVINPGINMPIALESSFIEKASKYFYISQNEKKSFPKIITVARLEKRKNHDKILMALKNLQAKFPKFKYVSIGDGEEKNNLLKLTNELGLNDNVVFLKNIEEKLKFSLISLSNLFIMPSIIDKKSVEGFGISFVEAASYGVGSIGGKDGGASDAISHNKTGIICDGNDLNSIYESINNFFDSENYIKFGKAAKIFSENFYWNKTIKNYLKLID